MPTTDATVTRVGRRGRGIQHPAYLNGRRRGAYESRFAPNSANAPTEGETPG
jgi:hypothetical protein